MRLYRIDLDLLQSFIVRQAPRAGKGNQIPRCDWLPQRTTLPARDCPFCSRNNISSKFKQVHKSFLSQNIFRDSKKIFCDFSVRTELEKEKTETRRYFCTLLTKREVSFFFSAFMDLKSPRSIKTQKENLANIQPPWPRAWSIIGTLRSETRRL